MGKTRVTSATMANGSFGIQRPGREGGVITVWFCGRGSTSHVVGDHCAHATRAEARACAKAAQR
jgi:hypothetical protein